MLEPLLHLVRNAASHGIESRDERIASRKAGRRNDRRSARTPPAIASSFEVEDDGAGIDVPARDATGESPLG